MIDTPASFATSWIVTPPPDLFRAALFGGIWRTRASFAAILRAPSAHHARTLVVELPTRDEELHRRGVVASPQAVLLVELVRRGELRLVDLDPEPGLLRHVHH